MSKESQSAQPSEEVDLGQLFKLIGNAFDRFFKFIGRIFYNIFLAFVWLVFFIKRQAIKLVIAAVIGVGLGFVLQKTSSPVYKSYITVKQNYETGEDLYNAISYLNDLLSQEDSVVLGRVLDVEVSKAAKILKFDIKPVVNENQRIKEYDAYIKTLDSTVAATILYEDYLQNYTDYDHNIQQITLKSSVRSNFQLVFSKIIDYVNTNPYFVKEQKKDIEELTNNKLAIEQALEVSDSLKSTYKRVLENTLLDKNKSEIGITFEGSSDKDKTKEFDLYKSDIELRRELVAIDRKIADKSEILEVLSRKQDSGFVDNKREIFGVSMGAKIFYGVLLFCLTFIVLLGLDFIKFLERFKR
ncbi:hypothetical protein KFZ70_05380 [Tamlana fucoidanivorans]|uniref:Uncharacterized protein n=1 Tax=Allotamlana fucoidanivorans TaxID=2583814 RepID=A0A5C4SRK1_9FLAO|nr:hypothetical protein [Tamlana fucoidanivorans]TNJ47056.1 hypothetical protein FGF67_00595 [Tamlana fucoidanivorans]